MKSVLYLLLLVFILTACSPGEAATPAATAPAAAAVAPNVQEDQPLDNAGSPQLEPEIEPTNPEPTAAVPAGTETAAPQPTPTTQPAAPTAPAAVEPVQVTYFTPSQMEGPYYPPNKPDDRDNDLVDLAGANGAPQGQILQFGGVVYDANGLPADGVTVEIWQTDANGIYLHPQDPNTNNRDPYFQFYGESTTGADGVYSFRTVLPGLYEPRPRHIHVKVKKDGQELLTTQFYFANEIDLQGSDAAMLIDTAPAEDDAGNPILVGARDIILSVPLTG